MPHITLVFIASFPVTRALVPSAQLGMHKFPLSLVAPNASSLCDFEEICCGMAVKWWRGMLSPHSGRVPLAPSLPGMCRGMPRGMLRVVNTAILQHCPTRSYH